MADTERALRDQAEGCLKALAGPAAALRQDQWTAIRALVSERRRALVVQRTGGGKSAVYFTATALLRARGRGPAGILSPLPPPTRHPIGAARPAGHRPPPGDPANPHGVAPADAENAPGAGGG